MGFPFLNTISLEGKKVIGVYSGKGGVGKTTIALNIARNLSNSGERVCLVDGDVNSPNLHDLMNIDGGLKVDENKRFIPYEKDGMGIISIAFMMEDKNSPIVWRGPLLTKALTDLFMNTNFEGYETLIVDLPPGTSDVPLTFLQAIPINGIVVVTTPHDMALLDARKAIRMIKMLNRNVIGVVENMSGDLFGRGKAKNLAEEEDVRYFGSVEMKKDIADGEYVELKWVRLLK